MMLFCYFCGPLSGMTVGTVGVVVYCLIIGGLNGLPGWAIGNLFIGFFVGMVCRLTQGVSSRIVRHIIIGISIVVATAIAMLGFKSLVETILYAQPMWLRAMKNVYAFVADAATMIASIPICIGLEPIIKKRLKSHN